MNPRNQYEQAMNEAVEECKRFMERVEKYWLEKKLRKSLGFGPHDPSLNMVRTCTSGAVKRASHDVSAAMVELRKASPYVGLDSEKSDG